MKILALGLLGVMLSVPAAAQQPPGNAAEQHDHSAAVGQGGPGPLDQNDHETTPAPGAAQGDHDHSAASGGQSAAGGRMSGGMMGGQKGAMAGGMGQGHMEHMMAEMKATEARLNALVAQMKTASGDAKTQIMADLLVSLVEDRKAMAEHMAMCVMMQGQDVSSAGHEHK